MHLARVFALAIFTVVMWSGSPACAGQRLSSSAIMQLFPGTFHAVVRGYKVQLTANRSGRLTGDFNGMKDKGRWHVIGGRLCIMLKDWLEGRTMCARVVRDGAWYKAKNVKFRKL